MLTLSRAMLPILFTGLLSAASIAAPISFGGGWSIDIAPESNFEIINSSPFVGGNDVLFTPHDYLYGHTSFAPSCAGTYCYYSRSLNAQITADPGRIITQFRAILNYGPMNNSGGSGVDSTLDWSFTGATYLGSPTDRYGNFDANGNFIWGAFGTQWKVTGDGSSGQAFANLGNFLGPFFGTNTFNTIPGLNYFAVNAANFSVDLDTRTGIFYQGGNSYIGPISMTLLIETAEAPPPPTSGAPVPSSMAIIGFGLLGLGVARRRQKMAA